mmetsp:Transcript_3309/g.4552  ORF Transcript_3309/g.4552 Transcript_3309/m.4552 type:complete len:306 (+) Transcript_3309:62-979(+)|eukprot:CAMPEP_0168561992 /NCGR_PEP_ID=MMETSP0413-20121227/11888_1 /TAXON_ID=136452 /ORGANISM="Filamoeba nolandi, Strain NC-AS-23-1" /LENGTH=305 /DNA_ID=CAMNT_0008593395 /DNA_START=33 /DNA_END=950 /DNA_ORIENTATION=+
MSLDIRLKKVDRIYHPGDVVRGVVVVSTKGRMSHNGIKLVLEGSVQLQLSAKSVGLFEAFYNSVKPIQLIFYSIEAAPPGKFEDGDTEIPFEFKLEPLTGQQLYETYHGVFVNIQYVLRADMARPLLAKNIQKQLEFIVEIKNSEVPKPRPVKFSITPDSLENVKKTSVKTIPKFKITGSLESALCNINKPFVGELVVEEADATIKSIEVQLVRVETCGCADGYAKEATEIQNIQIADGDVCRGLPVPIFMVFPRLFTCPTLATRTFKIEFECNLVVMLQDGHLITENFPIKLVRCDDADSIGTF